MYHVLYFGLFVLYIIRPLLYNDYQELRALISNVNQFYIDKALIEIVYISDCVFPKTQWMLGWIGYILAEGFILFLVSVNWLQQVT